MPTRRAAASAASVVPPVRPRTAGKRDPVASLTAALSLAPRSHISLVTEMLSELTRRDPQGTALGRAEDLHQLAEQAADGIVDAAEVWVEHLGHFYDTHGVAEMLSRDGEKISRQAVHKRKGLLALTTGNGSTAYPAFQFRGQTPTPGLADVLALLPEDLVSPWTVASWLRTPEVALDGQAPIDVLFESGPEGRTAVLNAAREWAAALDR